MNYTELKFISEDLDDLSDLYDSLRNALEFNQTRNKDLTFKIIRKYNEKTKEGTIKVKVLRLGANAN